jgi:hypothetical protein
MLRISAIVVLICGLCAGNQFGAVAGVGLAMLMSTSLAAVLANGCLGANTGLTTLLPIAVQALDVVSREFVGIIPSVNRDPSADRLAKNQTLYSWVTPTIAIADIAPGATVPQPADRTLGNKSISITNFKAAPFYFTGEEEKQLNVTGSYGGVVADTVEQAIRTIVNQVEADLALAMQVGGSRAYGTVATTPFATNVAESRADPEDPR